MKCLIILFLFLNSLISAQILEITGKVIDSDTDNPLPGANIYIEENPLIGVSADSLGNFKLRHDLNKGEHLVVSFIGYYKKIIAISDINVPSELLIKLEPEIIPAQSVLVEGSLGKEGVTPLAFSKIKRKDIEDKYTVQDVPEFLSSLPSTTFYSENGNGIGYNYLSIRGFDQRRISVSINGIPQNDPEDHNVYWLDFPDLLASTDLIQVQRGAGSGVFGYPAIGGSINIITSAFSNEPMVNLSASLGSYNVRKYNASFSSGLVDDKYSIYAKLSRTLSSGYRNLSWAKFDSYYLSAVRYDKNLTTQINFYGGPIADGLAYTGLPKFAVKDKNLRRANYSYWETDTKSNIYTYTINRRPGEIENFSQPHYELLNQLKLSDDITFNSALFLVTGNGFFDYDGSGLDTTSLHLTAQYGFHPVQNPADLLIKAQVENNQYGWIPKISYKHNNGELIIGGELRIHRSTHWGGIAYGANLPEGLSQSYRIYYFNGAKNIFSGFIHETYTLNSHWNFLGEIQLAYHKYRFYNEHFYNNNFNVDGLYLNPRVGINYKFNPEQNIFISFARVTREPRLGTYYPGEESIWGSVPQFVQNSDGSYNYNEPYVKPETMNDMELGYSIIEKNFNISLNFYNMIFDNEIVNNGKLDIFGQPITGNMNSTIHRGIEISASVKLPLNLSLLSNFTFSKNYVNSGTYYIDQNNVIDLSGNRIGGFPDILFNFGLSYNKNPFYIQLKGRYVGKFYSDYYDSKLSEYLIRYRGFLSYNDNVNDPYFTADFYASYSLKAFSSLNSSKIFFQITNIFDRLYSAYAIGAEFFPAAERNFLTGIQVGL
ncbi:MAG: TonB-dependent receptor [Ignavibacteriaceae bacterium]